MTTPNTPESSPPTPANPDPQPTGTPAPSPSAAPAQQSRGWGRLVAKYWFLLLLIVVGLALSPLAIRWVDYRTEYSITEDAFVEAHIVNVAPQQVSGRIVGFYKEERNWVDQGEVVALIDPEQYEDNVNIADSKVKMAKAELARQWEGLVKLKNEVPLQVNIAEETEKEAQTHEQKAKKGIVEAHAAVEVAKADKILAEQEFDRYNDLYKQKAVPLQRQQEVKRALDAAQARLKLTLTQVEVAKLSAEQSKSASAKASKAVELANTGYDQIKETEQLVEVKKKLVHEAQAILKAAKNELKHTQVLAPFSGVIIKRYRNLGDSASPGTPLFSMFNPKLLYVTANMEETRLDGVSPGGEVELAIDAFARPFKGRVVWINKSTGAQFSLMPRNVVSGEFTKVVQRVPIRIWIEEDERWSQLCAGMSVKVAIKHGPGDAEWATQAEQKLANLETVYNEPIK
jgi:membrane fusion protein (multidrug efflux system)